jgi:hypothetical protein
MSTGFWRRYSVTYGKSAGIGVRITRQRVYLSQAKDRECFGVYAGAQSTYFFTFLKENYNE